MNRENCTTNGCLHFAQARNRTASAFGESRDDLRRLAEKLEIHYTPKHGCWLNMAEIELSIRSRQCMNDYFETQEQLAEQIVTWERSRNESKVGIDWRFTTADARIKLKKLYPTI